MVRCCVNRSQSELVFEMLPNMKNKHKVIILISRDGFMINEKPVLCHPLSGSLLFEIIIVTVKFLFIKNVRFFLDI